MQEKVKWLLFSEENHKASIKPDTNRTFSNELRKITRGKLNTHTHKYTVIHLYDNNEKTLKSNKINETRPR